MASSPNTTSLTKQSLFLVVGRSIGYLLHLGLPIVLVRIFTKDDYGMYRQLFLIFATLFAIGQMGVSQSLYYFLPREPDKKDGLMAQTFAFVLGTGLLSMAGLIVFRQPIAGLMNNPAMAAAIPIIALYTFFMIGACFMEISMIAEGRAKWAAIVEVVSQAVNAAVLVSAALATRDITFVLWGAVVFSFLRFGGQIFYLKGRYRLSPRNLKLSFWKQQLSYAVPIGLGNVSWMIQGKLHSYFVSFLFNPAMFAIYSIGCFKLPILNIITASVANVMVPAISRHQKEGNRDQILQVWNSAIRKMNLLLFPVFGFFLFMAAPFIILLFTSQYSDSIPIFRVSLLSILIAGINTGAILEAHAQTRYIMKIAFVRLPVTLVILYLFIHQWGVLGAVAANVVSLYLFRIIVLRKVEKVLELSFFRIVDWRCNGKILLLSLLSGLPLFALNSMTDLHPFAALCIAGMIYPLAYGSLGVRFGIIRRDEMEAFRRFVRDKVDTLRGRITI
jgi:O-antigen/teichoic acid export membrane protein